MSAIETGRVETQALDPLVTRARGGNEQAFAELYRLYRRRVFGLCRHMLLSLEAAEDATSEVFLRARRAMSTFDNTLPFDRWLLSIASHHCIDQLRRRRIERRLFEAPAAEAPEPPGAAPSPLSQLVSLERRDSVRECLAALPEHYRAPILLRYYSEMSYDQIATALGLSRNNVATQIFRAKQELRRRLAARPEVRPL